MRWKTSLWIGLTSTALAGTLAATHLDEELLRELLGEIRLLRTEQAELRVELRALRLPGEPVEWTADDFLLDQHKAMTWTLRNSSGPYVLVGSDGQTDAYSGDTPVSESLPILAFRDVDLEAPEELDTGSTYHEWSGGVVTLTPPVEGTRLTSLEAANQIVTEELGEGWRMAEFHDGWGWNFWARGYVPEGVRFWVHIDNQSSNPWGSDAENL